MIREDIYEPLARYRDEFREKFARLAAEKFEELLAQSRVDEAANDILVKNIQQLSDRKSKMNFKKGFLDFLFVVLLLAAIGGVIALFIGIDQTGQTNWKSILFSTSPAFIGPIVSIISVILLIKPVCPARKGLAEKITELENLIREKTNEAWEQMRPLNECYTWRITAELIEATVPRIQFDHYFTNQRLNDLQQSFGWNNEYNAGKSVLFSHSGVINDNPFVFGELKEVHWGTKIYKGYKTISWTERVRDSDGKMRTVRKTETLVATVEKPIPVFSNEKILLYGNDAAPNLSFSREPSEHSGAGDGFFAALGKKNKLRSLKKLARNLDDDLDFTMMSNEEFELLFHAIDRDHEVEFRLLFTALAQQQMVNLLNDKEVGFGDDFYFAKSGKMNLIQAAHMNQVSFDDSPGKFARYSVKSAREYFNTYNTEFFKSVYFALAPLLTIPLYQQIRTHASIYGDVYSRKSSFWEHEAIANYYGVGEFKHRDCITDCILKTTKLSDLSDGSSMVAVTAYGYRGANRVDHVDVYGGDGRFHSVAVEWVEYLPVDNTSQIVVREEDPEGRNSDGLNQMLQQWERVYKKTAFRRSVFACLKK